MSELSKRFEIAVATTLAPALADLGFKRTRMHFRRVRGEIVDVISLVRSKHGDGCMVFLGMHLTFLPLEVVGDARQVFNLERLYASSCAFQAPFLTRWGRCQEWSYRGIFQTPTMTTRAILREYLRSGEHLFKRFNCAKDFTELTTVQSIEYSPKNKFFGWLGGPSACLKLARVHAHIGEFSEAREYANLGLRMLGQAAFLEDPLRDLAKETRQ